MAKAEITLNMGSEFTDFIAQLNEALAPVREMNARATAPDLTGWHEVTNVTDWASNRRVFQGGEGAVEAPPPIERYIDGDGDPIYIDRDGRMRYTSSGQAPLPGWRRLYVERDA